MDFDFKVVIKTKKGNATLFSKDHKVSFYSNFVEFWQGVTKHKVNQDDLMQSTGCFDETGNKLYDGDIIFWDYFDEFHDQGYARISFHDGCFRLFDLESGKETWDSLDMCIKDCTVYYDSNIYDEKYADKLTTWR